MTGNTSHSPGTPLLLFASDLICVRSASDRFSSLLLLCSILDELHGRRTLVQDLTDENYLPFLQAVKTAKHSFERCRRAANVLQLIWRAAVEAGLVATRGDDLANFVNGATRPMEVEQPVPDGKTSLLKTCEEYFALNQDITSKGTRYQYRLAIRNLADFLGRPATLDDLRDEVLIAWARQLNEGGMPISTSRERVGRVQSLWNWLAKRRMVDKFPTYKRPSAPDPLPKAMSEDQLNKLFDSVMKEREPVAGIPGNLWWLSFLAFVWNSSERKTAALAVRIEWIDFEKGIVTIPPAARKGGKKWGVHELWEETVPLLQAVIAAGPKRELVWPWDKSDCSYYTSYNRILRGAGLPVNRKTKTHGLRCSHATWLKVVGGDPTQKLGHGDMATTVRYYLDPTLTRPKQPKLFIPWKNRPDNDQGATVEPPPLPKSPKPKAAAVALIAQQPTADLVGELAWL
jgi:integrase